MMIGMSSRGRPQRMNGWRKVMLRSRSGGKLRAFHEEIREHALVALISGDAAIVRFEFAAAGLDAIEKNVQFGEILLANKRWFGDKAAVRFQIDEANGAIKFKL